MRLLEPVSRRRRNQSCDNSGDSAERPEDIDEIRAKEAKERAEEQLRQKQSVYEYRMSKASLARAVSRLKEKQRSHINL